MTPHTLAFAVLIASAAPPGPLENRDAQAWNIWHNWGDNEWYCRTERSDVKLYVREIGIGEPVLVLHGGWGAEHSYLTELIDPHVFDRRFILYDQRGSLRSPAPADAITLERHIEDIERIRTQLGLERIDILAHSQGTFLAMAYLKAHPGRAGALTLVGAVRAHHPLPKPEDGAVLEKPGFSMKDWVQREEFWQELEREGVKPEPGRRDDELPDKPFTKQWRISFAAANLYNVDRWRQMRGGHIFYNPSVYAAMRDSIPKERNFVPLLAAHDRPVTVILGDHDIVDFGGHYWSWVARNNPKIRLSPIDNAGHNSWVDAPEAVEAAVKGALAQI